MKKQYTLNDVALISGLTTRTLRNYITMGILTGEKIEGAWKFSVEDLEVFFQNPYVKPSIQAKKKAMVFDFLAQNKKKENEMCAIIDIKANIIESNKISVFFCEQINKRDGVNIQFASDSSGSFVRVFLKGQDTVVAEILNAYYSKA